MAPNILVVLLDDARRDDLAHMPNVQSELVNKGMWFDRYYVPFPWCVPSRVTFLTGQYTFNHQVYGNDRPWGGFTRFRDDVSLATWMDAGGYRTGWIGKYLNDYGPGSNSATYVPPGWDVWKVPIGTTVYDYTAQEWNINGVTQLMGSTYSTTLYKDHALTFVGLSQPWFLVASFVAPHSGDPADPGDPVGHGTPYVEAAWRGTYSGPMPASLPGYDEANISDKRPSFRDTPQLTSAEKTKIDRQMTQRRESLRSVDDAVNALIAAVPLNNTYIFLISDNGFCLGEHRISDDKVQPYKPATLMPLVVRGPGVPQRSVHPGVCGTHDLAPTITALAGVPRPGLKADGRSLVPALQGDITQGQARKVLSEKYTDNDGKRRWAMLASADHKVIRWYA